MVFDAILMSRQTREKLYTLNVRSQGRASDRSQKKKSNFAGILGTKWRKNPPILREFSGQTWPESNRLKNGGFCGYIQGKFR